MKKKIKYQAILFDLDGTLIDSKKDLYLTTNATVSHMGASPLSQEEVYGFVGMGIKDLVTKAFPHADEKEIQKGLSFLRKYYFEHCLDNTTLFDGVEDLLIQFQQLGVRMSVFTNKPQKFTDKTLKGLKIEKYFDCALGAENGFPLKPDPQGTNFVLKKMGVNVAQTLMVGDSHVDLETAQNVGMDTALMEYGFLQKEDFKRLSQKAQYVCKKFNELKKIILN